MNIYLDAWIVELFKQRAGKRGYQTLINAALAQHLLAQDLDSRVRRIVREELQALQALYGGTMLLDQAFSPEQLDATLRRGRFGIVHIAAHGHFAPEAAASFLVTACAYLVQENLERGGGGGRWLSLAPLLHSSALPVFAVLAVLVAVLYRAVELWLGEYGALAAEATAFLRLLRSEAPRAPHPAPEASAAPRRLFGLSFESRPPPLPVQ